MLDLLIQNVHVLQINNERVEVLNNHDIAIEGNKIDAVLPNGQMDPENFRVMVEGHDMIAMPGLVNAHSHEAMVLFRGAGEDINIDKWFNDVIWPLEMNLTAEDVYWGAQLGLVEMIEAGVTTMADHYFHTDQIARAVEKAGTRANLCWTVFSLGVEQPEKKLRDTGEFVKQWQGAADGRIMTWLGPHAPYTCDEAFLRQSADLAAELGVGIHIHVSETAEQVERFMEKYGCTPIGLLRRNGVFEVPTILAHAAHPTDDDIRIMLDAEAGIAHCPKTFLKLASGIAPVVKLRKAGVPVGIGSDGVVSNNTLDILEQTRLAAMMQKHELKNAEILTISEALTMATAEGARVVHMDNLGYLAPGKLADVILIRTDSAHMQPMINPAANVLYSAQAGDVDTVICNGKLIMHGRQLLTLDKETIINEVRSRIQRLHKVTPGRRIQTYES
jgi:5-methylthioadenosine/S-adenosylhomocysteine deaminase